ncbi:MAG: PH domain-containing protein [Candidatus Thiodiazotropha sp. (ex Lucinoma borealis)]|nr:PH domain-containing protein [Candidatus Thiodiazotropha sp. (ex Lucinoma borealis)]
MTSLIILAVVLLGTGLPIWLFVSTKYIVTEELLRIKSGPFSWSIPLSSISSVSETRNPLSSPALSLDRLELKYRDGKTILISPANKAKFRAAIGHPET